MCPFISLLQCLYISVYKILHLNSLITVAFAKTCEKVLMLNMTSTTKVKVGNLHS